MMVFAVSWYEPELPGGLHDWLASNISFGSPANLRLGAATALPYVANVQTQSELLFDILLARDYES